MLFARSLFLCCSFCCCCCFHCTMHLCCRHLHILYRSRGVRPTHKIRRATQRDHIQRQNVHCHSNKYEHIRIRVCRIVFFSLFFSLLTFIQHIIYMWWQMVELEVRKKCRQLLNGIGIVYIQIVVCLFECAVDTHTHTQNYAR